MLSSYKAKMTRNCDTEMQCWLDKETNTKHLARYVYTTRTTVLLRVLLGMYGDSHGFLPSQNNNNKKFWEELIACFP
jgi:hypothetical protein